ncbi:zeta toxin family protein [Paenibacillus koleovorans]|uniref:zeta toxin family protein n=1 Tax=Paenibacillus koleovorans TaxID=121608 RepID=UPI001FE6B624|nr:zeta toxin family protein [Paenibacillus koleovorans]
MNKKMLEPELYVFAGCNGAGKSTLIEHYGQAFDVIINPDLIAKQLNPSNPRSADLSAGKEAIRRIRDCLARRNSFAMETTLSGQYVIKQMAAAGMAGYKVYFYYIGLQNIQMHIDRVRTRVLEGGHYIAPADIVRRYGVSLCNLKDALSQADVAVVLDNSRDEYEVLVEFEQSKPTYRASLLPSWLDGLNL